MKILAIEDNDTKWARVEGVMRERLGDFDLTRASDLHDAEVAIDSGGWDLLILDMSIDIRTGAGRGGHGTHDYTGGLKIASRMFYNECEISTIIVTGFDAFPTGAAVAEDDVIFGLEDIGRQAQKHLGEHLLGTVRFGSQDWELQFVTLLDGWFKRCVA
jgi:hypothetical protein